MSRLFSRLAFGLMNEVSGNTASARRGANGTERTFVALPHNQRQPCGPVGRMLGLASVPRRSRLVWLKRRCRVGRASCF
jgi:hypothetical protein